MLPASYWGTVRFFSNRYLPMGKQYNKVIKRKRRQSYVLRKVAADAAAVKAKTAPRAVKPKAEPKAPKPKPADKAPVATEEHPAGAAE